MPTRSASIVSSLALLALAACRTADVSASESAGCHPACPGAQTASIGDAGAGLRGATPSSTLATLPAPVEARAPSPLAYLCPMHHHVGSAEPGRCPECGMTLVPRSEALEHDHDH
jgi:hypothetical protein